MKKLRYEDLPENPQTEEEWKVVADYLFPIPEPNPNPSWPELPVIGISDEEMQLYIADELAGLNEDPEELPQ